MRGPKPTRRRKPSVTSIYAKFICLGGVVALSAAVSFLYAQFIWKQPRHANDSVLRVLEIAAATPTAGNDFNYENFRGENGGDRSISAVDDFFLFSESSSPYFSKNIQGLRASLQKAFLEGCVPASVTRKNPLHIIFDARTAPLTQKYIQVQLEQLVSSFFNQQYISKLANAEQVWEFSPRNIDILEKHLPQRPFYLPTAALLNPQEPQFSCSDPQELDTIFKFYEKGFYLEGRMVGNKLHILSQRPSRVQRIKAKSAVVTGTRRLFNPPDILFYGQIEGSHQNSREKTCDMLRSAGLDLMCLQDVFGAQLEYFICHAKVVLSNQFYDGASLGTHRIDPLLLAKKIVVAISSSDPALDASNNDTVVFTKTENLASTLRQILKKWIVYSRAGSFFAQRMHQQWANATRHLCLALQQL